MENAENTEKECEWLLDCIITECSNAPLAIQVSLACSVPTNSVGQFSSIFQLLLFFVFNKKNLRVYRIHNENIKIVET